jgi:light-regulated signal transduction histidine kinase (bacteriophytochrome)
MVTSFLQFLLERAGEKLDAEGREFVGYAADGAERMQRMIRGLLAYSRVDQHGKGFAPTSLEAVLDQALRNLTTAVAENQAVVTHGPLPTLMGDEPLLVELLQNLIGNAIKFRRAEAPCIHVWAVRQNQEWVFAVRDNGIGIEPRHTERVFRIFQRLHSRTQYPGTGIGLALCARIVEHHHGRIWVDSVPGQGSTFRFTLPSTPGASSDEPDHRAGG